MKYNCTNYDIPYKGATQESVFFVCLFDLTSLSSSLSDEGIIWCQQADSSVSLWDDQQSEWWQETQQLE